MKLRSELCFAFISVFLAIAILATKEVQMSDTVLVMMLSLFVAGVLGYAVFIYKENPADERELGISLTASKYAYLFGAGILTLGIVFQSLNHSLDVWLPVSLAGMVLAKSLGYFFHNK